MLQHPSRGIFHCQGWGGLHEVICADLTCDSVTLMSWKFMGSHLGVSSRKEQEGGGCNVGSRNGTVEAGDLCHVQNHCLK